MEQPDRAYAGGADEDPLLAKLVGDPHLPRGGMVQGELQHRSLHRLIDPDLEVPLSAVCALQRLQAARLLDLFDLVERVARHAHHPAGLGDVAEFPRQVQ